MYSIAKFTFYLGKIKMPSWTICMWFGKYFMKYVLFHDCLRDLLCFQNQNCVRDCLKYFVKYLPNQILLFPLFLNSLVVKHCESCRTFTKTWWNKNLYPRDYPEKKRISYFLIFFKKINRGGAQNWIYRYIKYPAESIFLFKSPG